MKIKEKKQPNFRKMFIKRFLPMAIIVCVLTSVAVLVFINKKEQELDNELNMRTADLDEMVNGIHDDMLRQGYDFTKEEAIEEFELRLDVCVNDIVAYDELQQDSVWTDWAYKIYRSDEGDNGNYRLTDNGDTSLYIAEKDLESTSLNDYRRIKRVYQPCNVDLSEVYDFINKYRGNDPFETGKTGCAFFTQSWYMDEEKGLYVPEKMVLYKIDRVVEREGLFASAISTEEKLYKEISFDVGDVSDWEYMDIYDEAYLALDWNKRKNYSLYLVGRNNNGAANEFLEEVIAENFSEACEMDYYGVGGDGIWNYKEAVIMPISTVGDKAGLPNYIAAVAVNYNFAGEYGVRILGLYIILLLAVAFISWKIARRIYNKEFMYYQMLEYRKTLMNSMVHDLKSPLMAISGYAENLKEDIHTEKKDIYTGKIMDTVDYMNKIISDCMELSQAEEGKLVIEMQDIDISLLWQDAIKKYADKIKNKGLTVEISGDWRTKADEKLMRRVIDNLLDNAINYSDSDSKIEVELKDDKKVGMKISNPYLSGDDNDIDAGIDSKEIVKPFVKGSISRKSGRGSGLGLAIVKELLNAQKYDIDVSADEGLFTVSVIKKK